MTDASSRGQSKHEREEECTLKRIVRISHVTQGFLTELKEEEQAQAIQEFHQLAGRTGKFVDNSSARINGSNF